MWKVKAFIIEEQLGGWVYLKFLCGSTLRYIYLMEHQTVYCCKAGMFIFFVQLFTLHMNNNNICGA
jgi:hypothetical protein